MHKKKFSAHYNRTTYDHKTGLYSNRSGRFVTLAEANATSWICEKCQAGFKSVGRLCIHRDEVHSY